MRKLFHSNVHLQHTALQKQYILFQSKPYLDPKTCIPRAKGSDCPLDTSHNLGSLSQKYADFDIRRWEKLAAREGLEKDAFDKATWGFLGSVLVRNYDVVISMNKARKYGWTVYLHLLLDGVLTLVIIPFCWSIDSWDAVGEDPAFYEIGFDYK